MPVSYQHANNVKVFPAVKSLRALDVDTDFPCSFQSKQFFILLSSVIVALKPRCRCIKEKESRIRIIPTKISLIFLLSKEIAS